MKLHTIIEQASKMLVALAKENENEIEEALTSAVEESELQETDPKLTLSFGITLHDGSDIADVTLRWSTRHTRTATVQVEDPNQTTMEV